MRFLFLCPKQKIIDPLFLRRTLVLPELTFSRSFAQANTSWQQFCMAYRASSCSALTHSLNVVREVYSRAKCKKVVEQINHEIPIDEQFGLHKTGWKIQRFGWLLMLIFLVLSVAGLFGDGPVSAKQKTDGDFTLHYQRFNRYEHETQLEFRSAGETIRKISLPLKYIDKLQVQTIIPEPKSQIAENDGIDYFFDGDKNYSVIFYVSPSGFGNTQASVKINSKTIALQQFIFP